MALLVPNQGEGQMLSLILGKTSSENLYLKLFTSNTSPGETDTFATYTEATGNGYAQKTLTNTDWTVTEGAPTYASTAQQTFTFTGALGNVYGYLLVGVTSGDLYWAERFSDGPYNVQNNGDSIKITPYIELA